MEDLNIKENKVTGLEKTGLSIAAKSTTGIITTLFGPKIDRLKENIIDKDAKAYADKNFNDIFEKYLLSLHEQCKFIKTIVFPHRELLLETLYEPLYLKKVNNIFHGRNKQEEEQIDLLNLILNHGIQKNLTIIDNAGMGKSTFSKYLVLKILENQDFKKIPIFLELRKVNKELSLIDYIMNQISDSSSHHININIFKKLLEKKQFIFIFDGFDEVAKENSEKLGKDISDFSFKYNENIIILTTRNQEFIPSLNKGELYNFSILTNNQIEALILKFDNSVNIDIGKKLIKHENFKALDFNLFRTPLMVGLLYKAFGYNNTIDKNITVFYDELFNALYKGHDLTKAGFSRIKSSNLDIEKFRNLFRAFSFTSLYENKSYFLNESEALETIKKASSLASIKLDNNGGFFSDLNESVPLLVRDGLEYKFIHKTISEFFAAEFLTYSEISDDLFNKINSNKLEKYFEKSFEFLYKINSSLYIKKIGINFINAFITFVNENKHFNYNKYILNFLFLNKISSFAVAKKEDIMDKNNDINSDKILNKMNNISSEHYFYVKYDKVEYVIILTLDNRDYKYLENSYFIDDILLKVEDKFCINDYHMIESNKIFFDSFVSIFPEIVLNKWYDFFDINTYEVNNSDFITFICLSVFKYSSRRNLNTELKYIDFEKCQDLLSSIENKISVLD